MEINSAPPVAKTTLRISWLLSGLVILFLLFDSAIHLIVPSFVVDSFKQLKLPVELSVPIGVIELICVTLYAIPRTSVFGAVLQTGYLGGAVAILAMLQQPLFSHTLFPVYFAILLWGGLYLRNSKVRDLIPFRK